MSGTTTAAGARRSCSCTRGVFSDWFRPLSLKLPRDRLRVVRVRRSGYRDTTAPAGHLSLADHARHAAVLLDELGIGAACSHLMPLQQPASLARLITAFITTIPAASAADPVSR